MNEVFNKLRKAISYLEDNGIEEAFSLNISFHDSFFGMPEVSFDFTDKVLELFPGHECWYERLTEKQYVVKSGILFTSIGSRHFGFKHKFIIPKGITEALEAKGAK